MLNLMAIAVVESVLHALEDKNWHDTAYLKKHAQVHQVEHCEQHLICFFIAQLSFGDCCHAQNSSVFHIYKIQRGQIPL